MPTDLEREFHEAMLNIYHRARAEADYTATRFLKMVAETGGHRAAQTLLDSTAVSDGYTALWERGRLDLTVERLVLEPRWNSLFTEAQREAARDRLTKYKFDVGTIVGTQLIEVVAAPVVPRVTIRPEQCGGKPCIRGMRIRVSDVLGLLAHGLTSEQVLKQLPDLELEDIAACLEFAARDVDRSGRKSA